MEFLVSKSLPARKQDGLAPQADKQAKSINYSTYDPKTSGTHNIDNVSSSSCWLENAFTSGLVSDLLQHPNTKQEEDILDHQGANMSNLLPKRPFKQLHTSHNE